MILNQHAKHIIKLKSLEINISLGFRDHPLDFQAKDP